jgi:hypothetical protein
VALQDPSAVVAKGEGVDVGKKEAEWDVALESVGLGLSSRLTEEDGEPLLD